MGTAKKVSKKSSKKSIKTTKRAPGRVAKKASKKASTAFYSGERSPRGISRRQFHLLLTEEEYARLAKLTHSRKRPAANVLRDLIMAAK